MNTLVAPMPTMVRSRYHGQAMTADAFWALPDDGYRYEYVGGEAVMMSPAGGLHGIIATQIIYLLSVYLYPQDAGHIFDSSTGFRFPNGDVRSPDVAVILSERLPQEEITAGFVEIVPDLAIEVISPSERYEDIQVKVREYLHWGVKAVWVVEPALQEVVVYTQDSIVRLTGDDALRGEDAVPGFGCKTSELFPFWRK